MDEHTKQRQAAERERRQIYGFRVSGLGSSAGRLVGLLFRVQG